MGMTNNQIITAYKIDHKIPIDKPLYTYAVWLKKGYRVKRGEASRHHVKMWEYNKGKQKADTEPQEAPQGKEKKQARNYCFMKTMNLFEENQVERIKG